MRYTAVFIGGSFDMTKKPLNERLEYVYFHEPENSYDYMPTDAAPSAVPCKRIVYRLCGITPNDVFIYEVYQ